MKYRMYCLSETHLSGIQKAIQATHAIVEFIGSTSPEDDRSKALAQWMDTDKTIIILDGGTVQDMMHIIDSLNELKIPFATFKEPDLGWLLTSIAFLVDERVWDTKTYGRSYEHYLLMCEDDHNRPKLRYDDWRKEIGGKTNEFLKDLIFSLKLAI